MASCGRLVRAIFKAVRVPHHNGWRRSPDVEWAASWVSTNGKRWPRKSPPQIGYHQKASHPSWYETRRSFVPTAPPPPRAFVCIFAKTANWLRHLRPQVSARLPTGQISANFDAINFYENLHWKSEFGSNRAKISDTSHYNNYVLSLPATLERRKNSLF